MSNGKDMIIHLIVRLIKKTLYTNESILSYFPKPLRSVRRNFNLKVYLSHYATKTDLKNVTHVDTSSLALKTNLANLKT